MQEAANTYRWLKPKRIVEEKETKFEPVKEVNDFCYKSKKECLLTECSYCSNFSSLLEAVHGRARPG